MKNVKDFPSGTKVEYLLKPFYTGVVLNEDLKNPGRLMVMTDLKEGRRDLFSFLAEELEVINEHSR